jgi:hypothetical protein
MNIIWDVILLPWFGHGRMMECYLTSVCTIITAILIISPQQAFDTGALLDIGWSINPRLIAVPFATKAVLSGTGLAFNVLCIPFSQHLRFAGGLVGFFIWSFLSFKFILVGGVLLAFPFCLAAAYTSVRIMAFSLVDLPQPGNYNA